MESPRGSLPWLYDQFAPERIGVSFERLVALALVVMALANSFLPVLTSKLAPTKAPVAAHDDADRQMEVLEKLAKDEPGHPLVLGLEAWIALGVFSFVALQVALGRRAAKNPGEPLFRPEDDPTKTPPPWGLVDFGVFYVFYLVVGITLAGLMPSPVLAVEGGSRFPMDGRHSVSLDGTSARECGAFFVSSFGHSPTTAIVERGVLRVPETRTVPVSLNGVAVVSSERDHTLTTGDCIQVGATSARYEGPSVAYMSALSGLGSLVLVGFVVLIVRRRGGTVADLGLKTEGALSEAGRGFAGYLASVPVFLAAMFASRVLCRWLDVPFEEHPLLKMLEHDRSFATVASVVVLAAIVAPACEEVIYRGFLTRALRRPYPSRLAAAGIASFYFGAQHPGLASVIPITTVGALFSAVFLTSRRGSLVGAIVAHACFNGFVLAFNLALLRAGA